MLKYQMGSNLEPKRVQKEQNMEPFYLARSCSYLARLCAPDAEKKTEESLLITLARPCTIWHDRAPLKDLESQLLANLPGTTVPHQAWPCATFRLPNLIFLWLKSPWSIFYCNLISCLWPKLAFSYKYSFMAEAKHLLIFCYILPLHAILIKVYFLSNSFPLSFIFQQLLFSRIITFMLFNYFKPMDYSTMIMSE